MNSKNFFVCEINKNKTKNKIQKKIQEKSNFFFVNKIQNNDFSTPEKKKCTSKINYNHNHQEFKKINKPIINSIEKISKKLIFEEKIPEVSQFTFESFRNYGNNVNKLKKIR